MYSLLEWIVVILPFAAFLYLAVKPPKRVQWWALIAFGLAVSILTLVQQDRSRKNHERELLGMTTRLTETSQNLNKLSTLLDRYVASRSSEDEAKKLGDPVKQALQQAQRSVNPPHAPTGLTATPF
jgi:uncharacterized protein HemX